MNNPRPLTASATPSMSQSRRRYIPALSFDWLTFLYDPLLRWVMREEAFKRRLIEQAQIEPDHQVLDLGCGTGTLAVMIKRAQPQAEVSGLDADPKVLGIARAKAARAGVEIAFDQGMAFELPYEEGSFDRVLSSLLMHHLITENKGCTFAEAFRVLRPGGELHLLDLGRPGNPVAFLISLVMRRLEETLDNVKGRLPEMARDTGFVQVEETFRHMTMFGTLSAFRGVKPG